MNFRINGWTKDKLLIEAAKYEDNDGGADGRDYGVISVSRDYEDYLELRNRPDDWSELKAQIGIVGNRSISNMKTPIKSHKRKALEVEESTFEQPGVGWQPPSLRQTKENLEADFTKGLMHVRDMVEDFNGNKDDEKYRDIMFYQDTYRGLLSFLGSGAGSDLENKVYQWNEELSVINNNFVDKVNLKANQAHL